MADDEALHGEIDALARDVERAILEFDSALQRHDRIRQTAREPVFRSETVEFDDVQELFF
ncbi:hypothetical protein E6P09_01890 [Haloferax mediterranei ATCC 33500]|uniref:Uncharacterized protein n=1 Tax=Haloferax mediterranei (strain ATCC 33500 / DSM 1411 / JCM 8866 / NBRC 14739 / NCIMB 2177 / R-4) TaxID=523841 RepID=I3R5Z7_HALMT|nr:hypothetical protein [Haloferax mediterranei]AFK19657.1 hypothetical protein HFX_1961 [Haloferax mediterranei ATCC 33500]AHZ23045.1 hypothetical protein BM92_10530 [Haloferax mediterranei ATCC 33500]ELZ99976.1 hypothetical protein C439_11593 [Haloferax mediterranei ATCC 33500]MDX5987602.1 hypothetical protein [Haloferax mediterranei ATCC 33500]QCQ74090.1 hypothetical protein E6P09_01890 [Haloferax mediterranei ATCC 33500]